MSINVNGIMLNNKKIIFISIHLVFWVAIDCALIHAKSTNKDRLELQCDKALRYLNGNGVKLDEKEGFKLYLSAAQQGSARAQNQLGILYDEGIGVAKSCEESVRWYNKAIKQNYAKAKSNMAKKYHDGDCVDKDIDKSVQLYKECAEAGITLCMKSAAIVYYQDLKNPKMAFKWIVKAAQKGDAEAQLLTGTLYYKGNGVAADKRKASYWFRQAAAQGDQRAIEAIMSLGL
jgi:TPR repeat protein